MEKQVKSANWIPYLMIGLFLIVLSVDVFFIYIANKSWTGLATEDGYQKGLKYNQTLEAVKKQDLLGWSSKVNYDSASSVLEVEIFDKKSKVIKDAQMLVKFRRPVQEGFDFEIRLQFDGKGTYKSLVEFPLKGQWDIELQLSKGDDIYQEVVRIVVNG